MPNLDTGNTGFMLLCTSLVMLMTPGLAFFYGGLVRAKSVISMMMMSFGAIGLVGTLWILYGFNMAAVDSPLAFSGNPLSDFGLAALAAGESVSGAIMANSTATSVVFLVIGGLLLAMPIEGGS